MHVFKEEYTDLDYALDEMRSVLSEWSTAREGGASPEAVRYAQLVLHEWIANLLQHADFSDRKPTIEVCITSEDRHISCVITDNSEGFNLNTHLPSEEDELDELPEGGMGLRIIHACTDSLSYSSTEADLQRFEFFIPADHEPWLSMLF